MYSQNWTHLFQKKERAILRKQMFYLISTADFSVLLNTQDMLDIYSQPTFRHTLFFYTIIPISKKERAILRKQTFYIFW